jgi:hypothetical protein
VIARRGRTIPAETAAVQTQFRVEAAIVRGTRTKGWPATERMRARRMVEDRRGCLSSMKPNAPLS